MTLTPIQKRILALLLQGKTQKEAAAALSIKRSTLSDHLSNAGKANGMTTLQMAANFRQMTDEVIWNPATG